MHGVCVCVHLEGEGARQLHESSPVEQAVRLPANPPQPRGAGAARRREQHGRVQQLASARMRRRRGSRLRRQRWRGAGAGAGGGAAAQLCMPSTTLTKHAARGVDELGRDADLLAEIGIDHFHKGEVAASDEAQPPHEEWVGHRVRSCPLWRPSGHVAHRGQHPVNLIGVRVRVRARARAGVKVRVRVRVRARARAGVRVGAGIGPGPNHVGQSILPTRAPN